MLALIIAVAAVGCTPISLNAEWAYRTDKVELPIGVYSYLVHYDGSIENADSGNHGAGSIYCIS